MRKLKSKGGDCQLPWMQQYFLARLSLHSVHLQRLAQESEEFVGFSKLTQLTRNNLEQAHKRYN
jgi:hypothetical protein